LFYTFSDPASCTNNACYDLKTEADVFGNYLSEVSYQLDQAYAQGETVTFVIHNVRNRFTSEVPSKENLSARVQSLDSSGFTINSSETKVSIPQVALPNLATHHITATRDNMFVQTVTAIELSLVTGNRLMNGSFITAYISKNLYDRVSAPACTVGGATTLC